MAYLGRKAWLSLQTLKHHTVLLVIPFFLLEHELLLYDLPFCLITVIDILRLACIVVMTVGHIVPRHVTYLSLLL